MNRTTERHELEPQSFRDRWNENDDRSRIFGVHDDFRDDPRRASMMRHRDDDRFRRYEGGYGVRGGDRDRFQDPMGYSREPESRFRSQGGYGDFGEVGGQGYRGQDERGFFRGQDFYRGQDDRSYYRGQDDRSYYRGQDDRSYYRGQDDRSFFGPGGYYDRESGSNRPHGGWYGVPHPRDEWQGSQRDDRWFPSMRGYGSRQDFDRWQGQWMDRDSPSGMRQWGRQAMSPSYGSGPMPAEGYLRSGRGKGPKNFTRSDERIREDVCLVLEESDIDASDIDVRVSNGDVTLEGTVDSRWAKREVEDIVSSIRGARDCHNQLRVTPHDESSLGMQPSGSNGGRSSSAAGRATEQRRSVSS